MECLGVGCVEDQVWREQTGFGKTAQLLYTEPGKAGNQLPGLI
jgi:hypothetical protein